MTKAFTALEFTGERFIPGTEGAIEFEHWHRYLLAQAISADQRVLDIACGEGYGSAALAESAAQVIGVDIDPASIAHARTRYQADNLQFLVGDCTAIPLPDAVVDLIVSFETIEHHTRHAEMMREIKRVLQPDGVLLISSPDRYFYSELPGTTNPYHVKELDEAEFKQLVESHFRSVRYFGQRVCHGSLILPQGTAASMKTYTNGAGTLLSCEAGLAAPIFWLALASDGQLPDLPAGLFEQPIEQAELVRLLRRDLENAQWLIEQKDAHLTTAAELLAQKDTDLAKLSALSNKWWFPSWLKNLLLRGLRS
ncbi:hypothetical protein CKO42_04625 [Lamprobacter modestohalophilus]|uniref:Methyltransferase type 11 domain-containing protein n=1 Tax=Lamprobacter modestohalophilus TaxID=1064514 RepID=A0A9X0W6L5_9GAMM|nr:class I SAM-dependent methyltransferase [Lamprobacter modestohalophilus]MBK1617750.1 hypothetical protein [Lamprobacter modestohalophilus]